MAPRKNTEAKDTAPAPTELTEDNIDELDDEALAAAMEAMEAGDVAPDASEEVEATPEPSEAKETAKAEDAEGEEPKPDEQAAKAPEQSIPKSRLDKEVAVRKAAEERNEQMQKRFDQLLQMLGKGDEKPKQQDGKPEQWIDPRKDIFGAYEQLRKGYEQLAGHTNNQFQQTEEQRQINALITESDADIEAFRAEAPDIDDALGFLRESRKKELAVWGITDPMELRRDLTTQQLQITQQAKQMGVRPAQLLHQIAMARGYQPQAGNTNNAAQAGAKPTASAADPSKLIDDVNKLEATKQRSQSLGGSGAPVEVSGITMEELATMPEAEFKKLAKLAEEKGVDILELVSA